MKITIGQDGFADFVTGRVSARMNALCRSFEFAFTMDSLSDIPFRKGQACKITIEEKRILTGFIERIKVKGSNKGGNSYTIGGRDKLADLMDSELIGLSDTGITVKQACEAALAHLGIDAKVIDNADTDSRPFEEAVNAPEPVDKAFDWLALVARRRQALLTSTAFGNLVITRGIGTPVPGKLINRLDKVGNNLIDYEFTSDDSGRFNIYAIESQGNPSVVSAPITAAQIANTSNSVKDDAIRSTRVRAAISEDSYDEADALLRAKWERDLAIASAIQYQPRQAGWTDDDGNLWEPNTTISVDDGYCGLSGRMLAVGIDWLFDGQGRTTRFNMTDRKAFQLTLEDTEGLELA